MAVYKNWELSIIILSNNDSNMTYNTK